MFKDYSFLTKEILEKDIELLKNKKKICEKYGFYFSTLERILNKFDLKFNSERRIYKCFDNIFSEDNEISFYLSGFIAADGNISKDINLLQITLSDKDKNHLLKMKELFQSNSPIAKFAAKDFIGVNNKLYHKTSASSIRIRSKNIYNDLTNRFNIVPVKSLILTFPQRILNSPYIHHFIRGYFDGDGSANATKYKNGNIRINFELVGTYDMLSNIQNIITKETGANKNKIVKKGNIFRLRYNENGVVSAIHNFLYKNTTIFLKRKEEILRIANSIKQFQRKNYLFK